TEICAKKGIGQIYVDYILKLHQDLSRRGYLMQFWADIILQFPEIIPQLPKDVIALDWGYEANHPFESETSILEDSGVPYYICPGTSSWNSIGGRVDNMLKNCEEAAQSGLKNGAIGYLLTDWGDNGHWQQLPISYPGFVTGAAFSWCLKRNQSFDLPRLLNHLVFKDRSGLIGQMMINLGNEFKSWGLLLPNSSPLFWLLQESEEVVKEFDIEDRALIHHSIDRLENLQNDLKKVDIDRSDAIVIKKELQLTLSLQSLACKRALYIFGEENSIQKARLLREINELMGEFRCLWLKRNRPGGLMESVSRFDTLLEEYQSDID
ncbi:MAG: glycoside hydrolase, partial [Anaerolineales bacterium]